MKVLFTPLTGSSIAHTVRSLALADGLVKRGNDVYFTSCDVRKQFIENQGYKVVKSYPTVNLNDPEDQSVNYLKDNKIKIVNWFRAEIEATKEIQPDVVINAPGIFGPYTFYATGIPVVSIVDSQYLDEARGLMGLSLANDTLVDNLLGYLLRPIFQKNFTKLYLSEILDAYNQLGLKSDFKTRQELYSKMAVLIPSDNIFEPLRIPRENTLHVGPIFWEGFEKMYTDLTDKNILSFKEEKKLVYVAFGASVFDKRFYDVVLKSLSANGYKVVVSLGPNWKREEFPPDSKNVLIRNLVPGMRLSKYADVVVNTGSQGAVMQALTYGKPQIAFPTTMDQAFFANRLEELKIGINVNKISLVKFSKRESYSGFPDNLEEKILSGIDELVNNDLYRRNAENHSRLIASYNDPIKKSLEFIRNYINL